MKRPRGKSGDVPRGSIVLRGVRHNNLKGFDLDLPHGELIVVTGLSGSGKSSLAFDTLFAEGQRRYIETFSPYARQFFDRMDKPQVDRIEGIPPAIAIEQRNSVKTTRSTVGTITEICEHMKAVWPHISQLICPGCGEHVHGESSLDVWNRVSAHGGSVLITFDLPLSEKLAIAESLELIVKQGFQRVLIGGGKGELPKAVRIDELNDSKQLEGVSSVTVIQDRVRLNKSARSRFIESCEQAYHFGKGRLKIRLEGEGGEVIPFSKHLHCARCDTEFRDPSPALFSFNHPVGACPRGRGFGRIITIDYRLAVPDGSLTLAGGAVKPWQTGQGLRCQRDMMKFVGASKIPVDVPFNQLTEKQRRWVVEGDLEDGKGAKKRRAKKWYGVKGYFDWLETKAYKMHVRVMLSRYRAYTVCPDCRGSRLQPAALNYRLKGGGDTDATLPEFYSMSIGRSGALLGEIQSARRSDSKNPVDIALGEVVQRLRFLDEIGLGYLTLDRPMRSLSGGETERVSITSCLGSRMVNTLYVLDEPSVGLHPRDTERLITILKSLRDLGNTVIVVEHEASVMAAADQIVDLGPGHGESGGDLIFQGTYKQILRDEKSLTGAYLSGREKFETRKPRPIRLPSHPHLTIHNARRNNLQIDELVVPLERFVCITGVSGSGKSTLLRDVLLPLLGDRVVTQSSTTTAADVDDGDEAGELSGELETSIAGLQHIEKAVLVDQSILGKTPRSNPAVYTGAFDSIRELFARTPEAKEREMKASAFSFNSTQGQCEHCRGTGYEKIEMQFLSDVFIKCVDCDGRRYRDHVLEVKLSAGETSWSVADILDATVDEVVAFLSVLEESARQRKATRALELLQEVGLGYLKLGQPVNTLSGGESQRLKLVRYLAEFETKAAQSTKALFLFDEPTTGLHFDDVRQLLKLFQRLVDAGHSLIVIEHNIDVIRSADWITDLGPDAGENGGKLVAEGTPSEVAKNKASATGRALAG